MVLYLSTVPIGILYLSSNKYNKHGRDHVIMGLTLPLGLTRLTKLLISKAKRIATNLQWYHKQV